jgi:hypothetical protein
MLVAAAIVTTLFLIGVARPLTSVASVLIALATLSLVVFDTLFAWARVLHGAFFLPTVPGPGFFVALVGTAGASVAALTILVTRHDADLKGPSRNGRIGRLMSGFAEPKLPGGPLAPSP